MLQYSFCGMGGLEADSEEMLWNSGVLCWNDYRLLKKSPFSASKNRLILLDLDEAQRQLEQGDNGLEWFFHKLPPAQRCRLLPYLNNRLLYIDLETTGLSLEEDVVTTISIYDGSCMKTFVRGIDLEQAVFAIPDNSVLVTYNGTYFDVPFLRRVFNKPFKQMNLDLRQSLSSQGFHAGLKVTAKILGLKRRTLADELDGIDAVTLWNDYQLGNQDALQTLIAYNQDDVYALVDLLKKLYNLSMRRHLFFKKYD